MLTARFLFVPQTFLRAERGEQGFTQEFAQVGIFLAEALGYFAKVLGHRNLSLDSLNYLPDVLCHVVSRFQHQPAPF